MAKRQPASAISRGNALAVDPERIGALLRMMRAEAGLSQADVALAMRSNRGSVARIESGQHEPTLSTLAAYTSACGRRVEELFGWADLADERALAEEGEAAE